MIVVTGMHRSGTSLTALALRELGLDFGPESAMYDADDWNARGYLERSDIVDLNSRAITGFNRTTGKATQIASQISYLLSSTRPSATAEIAGRIHKLESEIRELDKQMAGLAVKDPRFCLTIASWEQIADVEGVVVALRHPSAAVASLHRRNKLPPALGHRFWRWHMESVLAHIGPETLVLLQEDLVGERSQEWLDTAASWLADRGIESSGDAESVIEPSLVHHQPSDEGVPAESLELWEKLCNAPSYASQLDR